MFRSLVTFSILLSVALISSSTNNIDISYAVPAINTSTDSNNKSSEGNETGNISAVRRVKESDTFKLAKEASPQISGKISSANATTMNESSNMSAWGNITGSEGNQTGNISAMLSSGDSISDPIYSAKKKAKSAK